jgi:hypothetical protein
MNRKLKHFLTICVLSFGMKANGQIVNGTFDVNNPGSWRVML